MDSFVLSRQISYGDVCAVLISCVSAELYVVPGFDDMDIESCSFN
jgi:hypothetical protein